MVDEGTALLLSAVSEGQPRSHSKFQGRLTMWGLLSPQLEDAVSGRSGLCGEIRCVQGSGLVSK